MMYRDPAERERLASDVFAFVAAAAAQARR
jgi:hypothetical protein